MQHRNIVNTALSIFDFSAYPLQVTTNVDNFVVSWNAQSQVNAIGSTGYRLWDTNILPSTGSRNISINSPLTLPLSNANLPSSLFAVVIPVYVNGVLYAQGFSNSPDNGGIYPVGVTSDTKSQYWINMYSLGRLNGFGVTDGSLDYTFNNVSAQSNGGVNINIYFDKPLIKTLNITRKITFFSYNTGFSGMISGSTAIAPGQTQYLLHFGYMANDFGSVTDINVLYQDRGYYKFEITTDDPTNYASLLPFYYWGQH